MVRFTNRLILTGHAADFCMHYQPKRRQLMSDQIRLSENTKTHGISLLVVFRSYFCKEFNLTGETKFCAKTKFSKSVT